MGYSLIAALDAFLHAFSDRHFLRKEADYQQTLQKTSDNNLKCSDEFHMMLQKNLLAPSQMQQRGERNGEMIAPWMLATFLFTIPLMGVNRAAAFLTTTFGAHLRKLGPYTNQRLGQTALQQGILITKSNALERAMGINTIIFDRSYALTAG